MKLTPREIKEGNHLIAKAIGYIYYEPSIIYEFEEFSHNNDREVFSKIPIAVEKHGGETYFADLPNPDYGKDGVTKWNPSIETLSWITLNWGQYIYDLKYHLDWNEFMYAWEIFYEEIRRWEKPEAHMVSEIAGQMKLRMLANELSYAFELLVSAIKWHNNINKK